MPKSRQKLLDRMTSNLEEFVKNRFHINKVFRVVNGELFENNDSNEHEEE